MSIAPRINTSSEDLASASTRVRNRLPFLDTRIDYARNVPLENAAIVHFLPQQIVFHSNGACELSPMLLSGTLRVQLTSSGGGDVVRYHIRPRNPCVLTTTCLSNRAKHPAEAVAESAVETVAISQENFHEAFKTSLAFREYILSAYSRVVASIISQIKQLPILSIDKRLSITPLVIHETSEIRTTYQELAAERGSAREEVSRRLMHFEKIGRIQLARSLIIVSYRIDWAFSTTAALHYWIKPRMWCRY